MYPTDARPAFGRFVYDQVQQLQRLPNVQVEVFSFSGGIKAYPRAARALRKRYRNANFDLIHCHYGLSGLVGLALPQLPLAVTFHGTDLNHPVVKRISRFVAKRAALPATVSKALTQQLPGAGESLGVAVLPCGVDTERFQPQPRQLARQQLGLKENGRYLLFPAAPQRPEKRHQLAQALATSCDCELLTLGNVDPQQVPLYVNAANAVVVTSEREGFGLAALEALACDVPVLSTPVGIAPLLLSNVAGCLCAEFDLQSWQQHLTPYLTAPEARVTGRQTAELFSAEAMAKRVYVAWGQITASVGNQPQ